MSKISFAVIAYNTEQQYGLVLCYPSKNGILPPGSNLSPVWEPLLYCLQYNRIKFSYYVFC